MARAPLVMEKVESTKGEPRLCLLPSYIFLSSQFSPHSLHFSPRSGGQRQPLLQLHPNEKGKTAVGIRFSSSAQVRSPHHLPHISWFTIFYPAVVWAPRYSLAEEVLWGCRWMSGEFYVSFTEVVARD